MGKGLLIALATIGAVIGGITLFITGLPEWKIAVLVVAFGLAVIGTMFLCLQFFARTLDTRLGPRAQPGDVIEADYRPANMQLQNYRPPAQLAQPRRITVPISYNQGAPVPFGMVAEHADIDPVMRSVLPDDTELAVPLKYLIRFAKMERPTRVEWVGKPQLFYDAQRFYSAHGMMQDSGSTKAWRPEYPARKRAEWLQQFSEATLLETDAS